MVSSHDVCSHFCECRRDPQWSTIEDNNIQAPVEVGGREHKLTNLSKIADHGLPVTAIFSTVLLQPVFQGILLTKLRQNKQTSFHILPRYKERVVVDFNLSRSFLNWIEPLFKMVDRKTNKPKPKLISQARLTSAASYCLNGGFSLYYVHKDPKNALNPSPR